MALLVALAGGDVADARAAQVDKPNVVVVTTDDWTLRIASRMPNFRRLARLGTTFANAFVSYDLCCPARTTFLTGQYAHNHGVRSNFFLNRGGFRSFRTAGNSLPVWLQRAGYRTAFAGKYLNEYGSTAPRQIPPGWDDWHGLIDYSTYNYFNWAINENGRVNYHGDRKYADALIAFARAGVQGRIRSVRDALAVMNRVFKPVDYYGLARERDYQVDVVGRIADQALRRLIGAGAARSSGGSGKPFFLWYTPIAAHKEGDFERVAGLRPGPAQAVDPRPPARYAHTFDSVGPPSDPSIDEADVSDKPASVRDRPLMSPDVVAGIRRNERGRLGAARAADDAIGRLLDTLTRAGELDDTLFVYTTDQGYLQGQHRIPDNKYFAYEPGIHIPMVMAGPGVPRGRTVRDLVFNHDLAPTIVDAAQCPLGARDGRRVAAAAAARQPARAPRPADRGARAVADVQDRRPGVRPPGALLRGAHRALQVHQVELRRRGALRPRAGPLRARQPRGRSGPSRTEGPPGRCGAAPGHLPRPGLQPKVI